MKKRLHILASLMMAVVLLLSLVPLSAFASAEMGALPASQQEIDAAAAQKAAEEEAARVAAEEAAKKAAEEEAQKAAEQEAARVAAEAAAQQAAEEEAKLAAEAEAQKAAELEAQKAAEEEAAKKAAEEEAAKKAAEEEAKQQAEKQNETTEDNTSDVPSEPSEPEVTEPVYHEVLFVLPDGTALATCSIKEGDKLDSSQIPADPAPAEGMQFDGWRFDDALKAGAELAGMGIDKPYRFEAAFSAVPAAPGEEPPAVVEPPVADTPVEDGAKQEISGFAAPSAEDTETDDETEGVLGVQADETEYFHITYDLAGGVSPSAIIDLIVPVDNVGYETGEYITLRSTNAALEKAGKKGPMYRAFIGWQINGQTYLPGEKIQVLDSDIAAVALYAAESSTVIGTFKLYNNNDANNPTVTYVLETRKEAGNKTMSLLPPANLFKGYLVGYWLGTNNTGKASGAPNEWKEYSGDNGVWVAQDTEEIKEVPKSWTVTFKTVGNGSFAGVVGDGTVTVPDILDGTLWDEAITKIPTPVADAGYYFEGWDPVLPVAGDGFKINDDLTYVAKFTETPKVTLTFEVKGELGALEGTTSFTREKSDGSDGKGNWDFTTPTPVETDAIFVEWQDESENKIDPETLKNVSPTVDRTIYAVFRAKEKFTLTFEATEGGALTGYTGPYEADELEPWAYTAPGYTCTEGYYFTGWTESVNNQPPVSIDNPGHLIKEEAIANYTITANFKLKTVVEVVPGVNKDGSVSTTDLGKVYGEKDPEFVATGSNLPAGAESYFTVGRASGENAGGYPITITLNGTPEALETAFPEYSFKYDATATFTISKKPVTLTANSNRGPNAFTGEIYTASGYTPAAEEWLVKGGGNDGTINDTLAGPLTAMGERVVPGTSKVLFMGTGTLIENGATSTLTVAGDEKKGQTLSGASNYEFTLVLGEVIVEEPGAKLGWAIVGDEITREYNGKEHKAEYKVTFDDSIEFGTLSVSGIKEDKEARRTNVNDDPKAENTDSITAPQEINADEAKITLTDLAGNEWPVTEWFGTADVSNGFVKITPKTAYVGLSVSPTDLKVGEVPTAKPVYSGLLEAEDEAVWQKSTVEWNDFLDKNDVPGTYTLGLSKDDKAAYGNYTFTYGNANLNLKDEVDVTVHKGGALIYNSNGVPATVPDSKTDIYPTTTVNVDGEAVPNNKVWTFLGWDTDPSAETPSTNSVEFAEKAPQLITVYAIWKVTDTTLDSYKMTDGGGTYNTTAYKAGWKDDNDPAKDGFTVAYTADRENAGATNPGFVPVGKYAVGAEFSIGYTDADGETHTFSGSSGADVNVTPAPLTLTAPDATMTYGDPASAALNQTAPDVSGLQGNDKLMDVIGKTQSFTAADYAIDTGNVTKADTYPGRVGFTASGFSADNYTVSLVPGSLIVTKASLANGLTINVAGLAKEKVYDTTPLSLLNNEVVVEDTKGNVLDAGDYTLQYYIGGAWTDGLPSATKVADSGSFPVKAVLTAAGKEKYEEAEPEGTIALTIKPAPLTLTAPSNSIYYTEYANATAWLDYLYANETYSASKLAGDEKVADLPRLTFETDYVFNPAGKADDYTISFTAASIALENTDPILVNYDVTWLPGVLKVTARSVDLSGVQVNNATKYYSQDNPLYSLDMSTWPAGIDFNQFAVQFTRDTGEDAGGDYSINAAITPINGNYTVTGTPKPGKLTIDRLPVHLVVGNNTKAYQQKDPDPIAGVTEQYHELANPLPKFTRDPLNYSLSRDKGEDVGVPYAINATHPDAENPNYEITSEPGEFIITQSLEGIVISMGNFTKIYGNADPTNEQVMQSVSVSGLLGNDTADMLNIRVARAAGENVADYAYTISYDAGELATKYSSITATGGNLSITPRPVTLYANSYPAAGETLTTEDPLPQFTAFIDPRTPLVGADQLLYSLYLTDYNGIGMPPAGSYTIGFNLNPSETMNRNYYITVVNGTLTVTGVTAPATSTPTTSRPTTSRPATSTPATSTPAPAITPAAAAPAAAAPPAAPAAAPAVAAPAAPAPAAAAAPAPVASTPEPAPEDANLVELDPEQLPLAGFEEPGTAHWALLNLLVAIFTLVCAVLLFAAMFRRNKKRDETEEEQQARMAAEAARGENPEEDARNRKSGLLWRFISILAGIVAPIVFLLTENIRNPMIFVDRWTLLMIVILAVQVLGMLLLRHARNKEDDPEQENTNA